MSPELVITIFVLMALTIPAAIGGVFVFRGTYYKSLPGRIEQLEEDSERKDAALKRQADELQMWKSIATQTPEIRKLLEFYERHNAEAATRFTHIDSQHDKMIRDNDKQHAEILRHLISIEAVLNERGSNGRRS